MLISTATYMICIPQSRLVVFVNDRILCHVSFHRGSSSVSSAKGDYKEIIIAVIHTFMVISIHKQPS